MSTRVLELNDSGVSLSDEDAVLAVSPAYALDLGGRVEFGETAAAKSRLYPVNCHNAFWQRLSMEPLTRPLAHFRHTADIAHAHLLDLAEQADAEGDVIVVVPGSFSREQLSLLLGLLQHSPFNAVALIDAAVAAGVDRLREDETAVYLDLDLHQFLLTGLHGRDGRLQRADVLPLPDLGWESQSNTLVQLITDAFIQQCRFNPQHSAAWEQHLYNRLPEWLAQGKEAPGSNLLLEIRTESAVHQAKLTMDSIFRSLQACHDSIGRHVVDMGGRDARRIIVSRRGAELPGLMALLEKQQTETLNVDPRAVDTLQLARHCLALREHLQGHGQELHFLSALPLLSGATADTASGAPSAPEPSPTHVLCEHRAHPLDGELALGIDARGRLTVASGNDEEEAILGKITRGDGQWVLRRQDKPLMVNGEEAPGERGLRLGDRIALPGETSALELIQVQNGKS